MFCVGGGCNYVATHMHSDVVFASGRDDDRWDKVTIMRV